MSVLALDISGIPRQWISHDDAITYHARRCGSMEHGRNCGTRVRIPYSLPHNKCVII